MTLWKIAVVMLLLALGLAPAASAQYFGRNKVQYETFDFTVLTTDHFDIYYYPEEEPAVQLAARMAERWYARVSKLMRHELSGRQPLVLPVECVVDAASCAAFDQLVGSRIAVAGAELRFPLFGLFSRRSLYGPLPIEIAFFGDTGTAWTSDARPQRLGGDREWVRSVGAALRLNAFGYAIVELDYVRPLDRPDRGWLWQFNLTPGF